MLIILIFISVVLIVFTIIALRHKKSQRKGNMCERAHVMLLKKEIAREDDCLDWIYNTSV